MNRTDRLTAILLLLQEKPRTANAIAHHFEVSRRTVLRDVQALCEIGVPIVAREGAGGGYSLPEGYWLAPPPLSDHEAFLLLLALGAIAGHADMPFAPDRASLVAKLRALLPAGQLPEVERLLERVDVDVPRRTQRAAFLDPLLDAAQARRWVRVSYQSAERHSIQHLLPRQIYAQGGLWYCRAYGCERGEERTYRVDRIRALNPPADDFQPPSLLEPAPYDDAAHPQVVAVLTARGVAYVESEPHLGQIILRDTDGGRLVFRCPPDELDWYARYFASLGDEVRVEAPAELREQLKCLGQALAQRYESSSSSNEFDA
ncbi:MAG: helix-turn-helix transcriptional regulator [Roseiflexaceae bacterium]